MTVARHNSPVLFLDFDGVLNSVDYLRKTPFIRDVPPTPEEQDFVERWPAHYLAHDLNYGRFVNLLRMLDRRAVRRLNRLVEQTGAEVVISSGWRKTFELPGILAILQRTGFRGTRLLGMTPRKIAGCTRQYEPPRGSFIETWLSKHPQVTGFVILDDRHDMEPFNWHLVQTSNENGLLDGHVELAIEKLALQQDV